MTILDLIKKAHEYGSMGEVTWDEKYLIENFLKEHRNEFRAHDILICKNCRGTGHDGHDRCYPPNPYICEKCSGKGFI